MYKIFTALFLMIQLMIVVSGCSEGDIVTGTIDFTAALQNCNNTNTDTDSFVFYKIDPNSNRTLALNFTSTSFLAAVPDPDAPFTIALNGEANALLYREFNTTINGDTYFCANVPSNEAVVTREIVGSDGNVEIRYTLIPEKTTTDSSSYTREIVVLNATLVGPEITYRNEVLFLGSDEITVLNQSTEATTTKD